MAGACSAAAVPGPRGRTTSRLAAASRRAGGRTPSRSPARNAGEVARASIRAMEAAISRSAALTIARATVSAPSSIDRCSSEARWSANPPVRARLPATHRVASARSLVRIPTSRRGLRVRLALGRRDLVHGRAPPQRELPSHHRRQAKARTQPSSPDREIARNPAQRGSWASGLPWTPEAGTTWAAPQCFGRCRAEARGARRLVRPVRQRLPLAVGNRTWSASSWPTIMTSCAMACGT